jgi:type VI secretion system secreted protein VgrG
MNPKSGKAGSPVNPTSPELAAEADVADPGEVAKLKTEQIENKEGKYGAAAGESSKPHKPTEEDKETKSWIEIELVDEEDNPVPGEKYKITLPDGAVAQGTLDEKGFARVEGIDPGTCQITFPELDKDAWERI